MTKIKTNRNNTNNVPPLRFPEFSGEWTKYKVSKLLDFYSTNSLSWEQLEYDTNAIQNLHYGLIHVGLPTMVDLNQNKLPNIKEGSTLKNYELCKEGDVAFADASEDTNEVAKTVEFFNLDGKEVVCGLHTIHGRDNNGLTIVGFKGYAFASTAFHNQVRRIAQGTKIYSISTKNFSECYIGVPGKAEQIKVATLLRLIDARIATQNKIIEDLEQLKSALTDQLYSGQLRFHEFADDWGVSTFGHLTEHFSHRNRNSKHYPVFSVTKDTGFIPQEEQFESREIAGDDISSYKIIRQGEFAYNPARINVGSIARYDNETPCLISSLYVCIKPAADIDSDWLLYLLKSKRAIFYYNLYGEGGVRIYLFYPNFSRIKVKVPSIQEQHRIAALLKYIADKILQEKKLKDLYITQKQFLLQRMFI